MTIPEGATHVRDTGMYYKIEGGEWFYHDGASEWWPSAINCDDELRCANLKELPTPARVLDRDEALQWLVDNVKDWPTKTEGCNYPFGWSWEGFNDSVKLCHTAHDPITQYDWSGWSKPTSINDNNDAVHKPKHYQLIDGVESIQVIACSLTRDEWRGFCLGNEMKYRLRAGKKDNLQQEIDKANEYNSLFEKYKELNRDER